jgi:hypothetical protein
MIYSILYKIYLIILLCFLVKSIKNKDSIIFLFMIMLLFMGSVFYFTI